MSLSSAWYRVGTVTVTNNSASITGLSTNWLNDVAAPYPGDSFTVDNTIFYEVVSINSNTSITIDRPYAGTTQSSITYAIIRNSSRSELSRAASDIAKVVDQKQLTLDQVDTYMTSVNATENFTDRMGNTFTLATINKAVSDANAATATANSLTGSIQAMTKAEYDALAEKRIRDNAGSGFLEWGKPYNNAASIEVQNGLWVRSTSYPVTNTIMLGSTLSTTGEAMAISNINGTEHIVGYVNNSGAFGCSISLPSAPDGLDNIDGTRFTDLAAAIVAGGTGLTSSVITRQDLVLCKLIKAVDISVDDAWFPLGNRQFGATSFDGISLVNTNTLQAASAFGTWDTVTKGYSKKVSTSSAADLTIAYQNHKNNLYSDNGIIKQDQYQIVVHQGLRDYADEADAMVAFGYTQDATDKGLWTDGTDLFIPIVLVPRRNQGAGHPLNPEGCKIFSDGLKWYNTTVAINTISDCFDATKLTAASGAIGTTSGRWNSDGKFYDAIYAEDIQDVRNSSRRKTAHELLSYGEMAFSGTVRGFEGVPFTRAVSVNVTGGTSFTNFRTIVCDILPANVRGFNVGGVIANDASWVTCGYFQDSAGTIHKVINTSTDGLSFVQSRIPETGVVATGIGTLIVIEMDYPNVVRALHKSESPTWTDIIGSPANILATFPNGVEGQWIPTIPDGTGKDFKANRKVLTAYSSNFSTDSGATWTTASIGYSNVWAGASNSQIVTFATNRVELFSYKTKAKFLTDAIIADNEAIGDVTVMQSLNIFSGNSLFESLFDKVNVNNGWSENAETPLTLLPQLAKKFTASNIPSHAPLTIAHGTGNNVGKALFTITKENGQYFGQYLAKELIWGGTDWGDNNKIPVVNNTSTSLDLNAMSVITTNKRFKLPYFG